MTAVDAATGGVTISHGPVASLNWPAMKMDFVLANPSLVAGLKPGAAVEFEFVERQAGEWVVTSVVKK
ncbi:copper-binding protein [Dechloromonas sp. A34]|uniref:copper-binding protein n=1 Tax=Dechloromonas sp. A34 TaxID=447588 RepID=UPI002B059A10|nr:copper-binding protein [Dechloromonas sp. A34]